MAGDDGQYLSITDISRHFSLPESTCRYYCKRFAAFIEYVGEGRTRKYYKSTLDVIGVVLEEMKDSKTAAAVEDVLETRFPKARHIVSEKREEEKSLVRQPENAVAQPSVFSPAALSLLERQTVALEGIMRLLSVLAGGGTQNPAALPGTTSGSQEMSALQKRVDHLESMLGESEKLHQADYEQLQAWLQRIIRRVQKSQTA